MRPHKCNARNEKHVQRTWSESIVTTIAQPTLHPTVAAGFHPCMAGMYQSRRTWQTVPVNVVVDKRSRQRPWRLLLYHPRRHPRLGQPLNYCPLEAQWGMGTRWKMRSLRTCTRLTRQKSLQDRTQDCLYETWVRDGNDGTKENIRDDAHHQRHTMYWCSNGFRSAVYCYDGAVKKNLKQTVTSRIAQRGTRIPAGTGFGNLGTKFNVKCNRFSTPKLTVKEAE
jgi:hypothetical protein